MWGFVVFAVLEWKKNLFNHSKAGHGPPWWQLKANAYSHFLDRMALPDSCYFPCHARQTPHVFDHHPHATCHSGHFFNRFSKNHQCQRLSMVAALGWHKEEVAWDRSTSHHGALCKGNWDSHQGKPQCPYVHFKTQLLRSGQTKNFHPSLPCLTALWNQHCFK